MLMQGANTVHAHTGVAYPFSLAGLARLVETERGAVENS